MNEFFTGCLLGFAAGDALGAPLEGMSPSSIREEHGGPVEDFLDWRYPAGSITAVTQTMVVMAQALLELGRFEAEHLGFKLARFIEYSDTGVKEARGLGLATAAAARKLAINTDIKKSSVESGGCGPALRVAPLGLRYFRTPSVMLEAAIEQAAVTHTGVEALAGSVLMACIIAACVRMAESDEELDRLTMLEHLYHSIYEIDVEFAKKVSGLTEYLERPAETGFAYTGTGGYSAEAVPAALLAFMLSAEDLEKTLATAANAGGCASSIAAMAGAISGAHNGVSAIPKRLLSKLEGRDYIEGLANKLSVFITDRRPKSRPFC